MSSTSQNFDKILKLKHWLWNLRNYFKNSRSHCRIYTKNFDARSLFYRLNKIFKVRKTFFANPRRPLHHTTNSGPKDARLTEITQNLQECKAGQLVYVAKKKRFTRTFLSKFSSAPCTRNVLSITYGIAHLHSSVSVRIRCAIRPRCMIPFSK